MEQFLRLKAFRSVLRNHREEILKALASDLGKPAQEAYMVEYFQVMEELDLILRKGKKWVSPKRVPTPLVHFYGSSKIHFLPYGTVAIASPWNYPFQLSLIPAIEALAAGNRVILKTSRKSPATSRLVKKLFGEVYEDDQVRVYGADVEDRERFLQERPDFLFFTGSSSVGRKMALHGVDLGIPYVLELGGKSPALLTTSADLQVSARRIVWGKLMNAGQTCVAPDYLLVPESRKEEVLSFLEKALVSFYGDSPERNPDYGCMIDEEALVRLESLARSQGIFQEGDRVGRRLRPRFFFADLESPFMAEEIFGPYLPILTYTTFEEAAEIIEIHRNPLAFYLFTRKKEDEIFWRRRISFGGGCINDCMVHLANPALPFGGVGESGLGRYHGKEGVRTFCRKTSLLRRSFFPEFSLRYPPFKRDLRRILRK